MDVTVIVAAGRTSTVACDSYTTFGDLADTAAQEHNVNGQLLTLKVNGEVASRDDSTSSLSDSDVLELIEIAAADDAEPVASNTTPDDEPDTEAAADDAEQTQD